MKKYLVEGRWRIDFEFCEQIIAKSQNSAMKQVEAKLLSKLGISSHDILDEEIYVERIKEKEITNDSKRIP